MNIDNRLLVEGDEVDEVDGVGLRVAAVDPERANSRGIIHLLPDGRMVRLDL